MKQQSELGYTDKQLEVINHGKGNLLVSASAGSGKTKVLIAKIIDIILNKQAKLKDLLVVTFTNNACQEMKERLSKSLFASKDEGLINEIENLSVSDIFTFDKFCIKIVREFGYEVGISSCFSVSDENFSKFLKSQALDNIIAKHNAVFDDNFAKLMETFFGSRDDASFKANIISVYNFLQSKIGGYKWFREKEKQAFSGDFNNNVVAKFVEDYITENMQIFRDVVNDCYAFASALCSKDILKNIEWAYDYVNLFSGKAEDDFKLLGLDFNLKKILKQKLSDEEKNIKEMFNNGISKINDAFKDVKQILTTFPLETLKKDTQKNGEMIDAFFDVVEEFNEEYLRLKKNLGVLDFGDLERYAGVILENDAICFSLQNKYKYIFIDEYQDTNEVQENIIKKITTGDNLFMVGDVKQSIYKFRLAEPKIFINKYNAYKPAETKDRVIELNKNFRSERDVLEFCNMVFDNIMRKETADIEYKGISDLEFGEKIKECASENGNKVKVIVLSDKNDEKDIEFGSENLPDNKTDDVSANFSDNKSLTSDEVIYKNLADKSAKGYPNVGLLEDATNSACARQQKADVYSVFSDTLTLDETTKIEREALVAANEIQKLLGEKIYDQTANCYRNINFSDIAILSRKRAAVMERISKVLHGVGIPLMAEYSNNLFDNADIKLIVSILEIIQNQNNDISLTAVLTSIVGGLSFDEALTIRQAFFKEKFFYNCVKKYAETIDDEISKKISNCLKKIERYRIYCRSKNLCELINEIVQAENLDTYFYLKTMGEEFNRHLLLLLQTTESIKNYSLTEYLNYIKTFASATTYSETIKDGQNAVTLCTIHSSKGLEYPVVFLIDAGSDFSTSSIRQNVLKDSDFGISTKLFNTDSKTCYDGIINYGFKLKICLEEKKEEMRLLYVALTRAKNFLIVVGTAALDKLKPLTTNQDIMGASNYLEWILGGIKSSDISQLEKTKKLEIKMTSKNFDLVSYDFGQIIAAEFGSKNQNSKINCGACLPKKQFLNILEKQFQQSPLVLKNTVTQIMEQEAHYNISDFTLSDFDKIGDDDFLLIGNAYHKIMQNVDFKDYDSKFLDDKIKYLLDNKIISKQELELIDLTKISTAVSKIEKLIDVSDVILTEKQFLCYFNASDVIESKSQGKVLIQGVVDLIIIKPQGIILIDYKTSRIKDKNKLLQKYKTQLDIYAKALESFYKRPILNRCIYSFYLDKIIIVN